MKGALEQIVRLKKAAKGMIFGQVWRLKGARLSGRVIILGKVPRLWTAGETSIGHRVQFRNIDAVTSLTCHTGASLSIGDQTSVNEGVQIDCWGSIVIGSYCRIGPRCVIADTSYHEVDEGRGKISRPIAIGRNVWLAQNVMVMPGVSIGDNSVVAAGAVVTRSFPENSLIGGIPARRIREIEASEGYVRV